MSRRSRTCSADSPRNLPELPSLDRGTDSRNGLLARGWCRYRERLWPSTLRLLPTLRPSPGARGRRAEALVESYRRLAAVFHDVLSRAEPRGAARPDRRDARRARPATRTCTSTRRTRSAVSCVPVFARGCLGGGGALELRSPYGEGITGWAVVHRSPVLANEAHLDPRVAFVPGTPADPEALITVPLIARGSLKGALNIYRIGRGRVVRRGRVRARPLVRRRRGARARQRAGPRAPRAPRAHRLADGPLQPPLLPRAAARRAPAAPAGRTTRSR